MSKVINEWGEDKQIHIQTHCQSCICLDESSGKSGPRFSKMHDVACETLSKVNRMVMKGSGDQVNILEGALGAAYRKGFEACHKDIATKTATNDGQNKNLFELYLSMQEDVFNLQNAVKIVLRDSWDEDRQRWSPVPFDDLEHLRTVYLNTTVKSKYSVEIKDETV